MCKSNHGERGIRLPLKTSCFLLSARLRSLSATSCRLLLALLSLNDETRRSPHSLLETMRVCPANFKDLKTWKFLSRTFRIPSKEPNDCHGWHPFGYGKATVCQQTVVRFAHGCANLTTERGGFGFHSKTSCFLLSARLRSLSATSCRLLLALLSLNDETRRSPHSLLETMRVCPANSQRLKNMEVFKSYVSNPF